MKRFALYKYKLEITLKERNYDQITDEIEEALSSIDVWDGVNPEVIAFFENENEGLEKLQTFINYYHWMSQNRYQIEIYHLEPEEWDEDIEEWVNVYGEATPAENWKKW